MKPLRPWQTLEQTPVFSGGPITEIVKERVLLPDGRVVPDFYRIRMHDYALVYATCDDGSVLVFRHYRHGLRRVCLGFPGGAIADAETPRAAIERELLEETGYVADRWRSLGAFTTNANQGCNRAHFFVATGCRQVQPAAPGDLEEMELLHMSPPDLLTPETIAAIGVVPHVTLLLLAAYAPVSDSAMGE